MTRGCDHLARGSAEEVASEHSVAKSDVCAAVTGGRSVRKLVRRRGPRDVRDVLGFGNGDAKDGNNGEGILGEKGGGHSVAERSNGGANSQMVKWPDGGATDERIGSSSKRFGFGGFGRKMDGRGRTMNSTRTAGSTEDLFLDDVKGGSDKRSESLSDKGSESRSTRGHSSGGSSATRRTSATRSSATRSSATMSEVDRRDTRDDWNQLLE